MPGLTEAAVDARDQELDLVALRAVLGALEPRRHEHLDHRGRASTVRLALQESLEGEQLLRDALRVVEPLDAEDQSPALVLALQVAEQALRLRVRQRGAESVAVDADRIDADPDPAPVDLEPVRLGVDAEHPQARRAKVARVVARLEAHVVRAEHASQELLAGREEPVHLRRGERDVQEEPDREPRLAAAKQLRDQHQMEVVDPDPAVGLAVLEDRVGVALVHLDVALPRLGRYAQTVREVVEERPQGVVADASVEVLLLVGREEDRHQVVLRQALDDSLLAGRGNDRPGPADPGRIAPHGLERRGEPSRAARDVELALGHPEPDGQPVAGDDEMVPTRAAPAAALASHARPR